MLKLWKVGTALSNSNPQSGKYLIVVLASHTIDNRKSWCKFYQVQSFSFCKCEFAFDEMEGSK